eukprot:TRINITY_DN15389_c0_g2_i2.p1 TRINITY_DN15389_c0_g2~~TRINITY_DN15389_c0_g2_i2.p1  ORF type:complete len:438 (-),score=74.02 TRINITY_DN15389_c0_g2_i2:5-1318(-)
MEQDKQADVVSPLFWNLQKLIDKSSQLTFPIMGEYYYYKNFPEFSSKVGQYQEKACELLSKLKEGSNVQELKVNGGRESYMKEWMEDFLDDKLEMVDSSLDQITNKLSEFKKTKKRGREELEKQNEDKKEKINNKEKAPVQYARIPKPQMKFTQPITNQNVQFKPKAEHLASVIGQDGVNKYHEKIQNLINSMEGDLKKIKYPHPLEQELQSLSYPDELMKVGKEEELQMPVEPEKFPYKYVNNLQTLESMAQELGQHSEIAVDLENYSYRSFEGLTCLMQVSSGECDYVVDTLAVRDHMAAVLTPVFCNPGIIKVFHGAYMDVQWLQRDFHMYIINMFDTSFAAEILQFPSRSLQYLLSHFCKVKTDKRYQLADWRVRPLTNAMIKYARMDTHYLLYIFHRLKIELSKIGLKDSKQAESIPETIPSTPLGLVWHRS